MLAFFAVMSSQTEPNTALLRTVWSTPRRYSSNSPPSSVKMMSSGPMYPFEASRNRFRTPSRCFFGTSSGMKIFRGHSPRSLTRYFVTESAVEADVFVKNSLGRLRWLCMSKSQFRFLSK